MENKSSTVQLERVLAGRFLVRLTHLAFVFGAVAQVNHRTWMGFCRAATERERRKPGGGDEQVEIR